MMRERNERIDTRTEGGGPPALGHPGEEAAIEPNELKSKVVLNGCKSIRNNGSGS